MEGGLPTTGPTLSSFQHQSKTAAQKKGKADGGLEAGGTNFRTQQNSRQTSKIRGAEAALRGGNSNISISNAASFNQSTIDAELRKHKANISSSTINTSQQPGAQQPPVITKSMINKLKESIGQAGSHGNIYAIDSRSKAQGELPPSGHNTKFSMISE